MGDVEFAPRLDAEWTLGAGRGYCLLEQSVPEYGRVEFRRNAGRPLELVFDGYRDLMDAGDLELRLVAPDWHPDAPRVHTVGPVAHAGGVSMRVGDPLATEVLMGLYTGHHAKIRRAPWFQRAGRVEVTVSATNFRPAYAEFAACFGRLLPADWSEIERSVITFAANSAVLDGRATARLDLAAEYCTADPGVTKLFVDGHTDTSGVAAKNHALSKRRAKAVADYLVTRGIPRGRITTRYHADRYPAHPNASPEGRVRNRRATLRLERTDGLTAR